MRLLCQCFVMKRSFWQLFIWFILYSILKRGCKISANLSNFKKHCRIISFAEKRHFRPEVARHTPEKPLVCFRRSRFYFLLTKKGEREYWKFHRSLPSKDRQTDETQSICTLERCRDMNGSPRRDSQISNDNDNRGLCWQKDDKSPFSPTLLSLIWNQREEKDQEKAVFDSPKRGFWWNKARVPGKDKLLPRKKTGTFCPKDVSIFGKRLRLFLISPNVLSGRTYCCGKRSLRKTFPLWLPSGEPYHRNILRTDIYRKKAQNESMERIHLIRMLRNQSVWKKRDNTGIAWNVFFPAPANTPPK